MTHVESAGQDQPAVSTADRLSFTLFLALAIHALIILGVTFALPEPATSSQTIEITLATHKSSKAPDDADFLAQHHQEGSGTEETARQITTDQLADFSDTQVREVAPVAQLAATSAQELTPLNAVTTQQNSQFRIDQNPQEKSEQHQEDLIGEEQEQLLISQEIASLQATLDRQRQEYAKRPRIRTLTSVSTKASHDAQYLYEWSTRVEQVGKKHFPPEALARGITGSLRMSVVLNPDGTIHTLDVLHSSGHKILDDAARQIVRLAAPFTTFPPEIRQHADRLNIIRTWNFEIDGLNTSAR